MNDIIKIVKSLEESGSLIKNVSETVQNEAKDQQGGFVSLLSGTSGSSLLRNLLTSRGVMRTGDKEIGAGQNF